MAASIHEFPSRINNATTTWLPQWRAVRLNGVGGRHRVHGDEERVEVGERRAPALDPNEHARADARHHNEVHQHDQLVRKDVRVQMQLVHSLDVGGGQRMRIGIGLESVLCFPDRVGNGSLLGGVPSHPSGLDLGLGVSVFSGGPSIGCCLRLRGAVKREARLDHFAGSSCRPCRCSRDLSGPALHRRRRPLGRWHWLRGGWL